MAKKSPKLPLFPKGAKVFKDNGATLIGEMRLDVFKGDTLDVKQFSFYDNVIYFTVPDGFCIEGMNGRKINPMTLKPVFSFDDEDYLED